MNTQAAMILRFVFVGTSSDARAVADELRRTDFDVECEVVAEAAALAAALEKNAYDAVVADETLAGWSWHDALAVVRERAEDLPFILVSGTSGEERAVDAMRAGASDYVLKDSVARLGAVLEREIREAATRRERAHLYAELRQNKERFRRTFEKAPIGIANVAPTARFLTVNERLGTMVGYTRRELIGRRFSDIIHPDDVGDAEARHAAYLEGIRSTMEHERRLLHKDGRTVWARLTLTPVTGDDGELEQIIAIFYDITQQRFAAERAALQARLLDSVEQAVMATDAGGRITYWNRYAEELYGWRAHEVRGRYVLDVMTPERVLDAAEETMARLRAGERFAGESLMRRRDGETFPAWVVAAPIHDAEGEITGTVAVSHDISEVKRAERETRAQKEQLAEAQRIAKVGSVQYDIATGVQRWSDELSRIHGVPPGTTLSPGEVLAMVDAADRERIRTLTKQAIATAVPVETDYRIVLPGGAVRTMHAAGRVITDAHGKPKEVIAVAQDVTESRRNEEELRRFVIRQSAAANLGNLALSGAALDALFRQAAVSICEVLQLDLCEVVKAGRDGRYIMVAGAGWDAGVVGSERPAGPRSLAALTMRDRIPVVVHDITSDPRITPGEVLLRHGVRGAAAVPIGTTGELWGMLGAYARGERTLSDGDIDFLRTVATMLGQAIERIRADVELRVRAVQQSAIAELGQIAFSTVDEHTLRRACELAQNGLGVEYALVLERVAGELVIRAGDRWSDAVIDPSPVSAGSQSGMTAVTRVPVVVNDYHLDTRFRESIRELTDSAGVRSGISVPIHGARLFYGVFSVYSGEPRAYTEGDLHFMQSLANTLAEAIEREEATSALVKSEQRYRSVVEGASEIIFDVDRHGVICSLNRAFESITGYRSEDFIGRPFRDLFADEDGGALAAAMLQQIVATRQRVQWETAARRADGTRVVLEINSVPKEQNGEIVSMHGFARDVTEARRTEQERQQLTANLQLLLESTAEGIFAIDVDGRCQLVNRAAARMLQRGDDQLLGRDMHELTHGTATHARRHCPLLEVARTEMTIVVADETFQRADGSPFPVEYSAAPLIDQGRAVGVVVTFTDISERRKLEAKLEQANRLSSLGRLAATVAHEFNNVLMGIAPFVEVIRRTTERDRIEASLGQIALSVARGKRITSEILRFTQPAEPVRAAVEVAEWLRALATEARTMLSATIVLDVASQEGIAIHADANQIHQTVMNLIVNARDAMPGGGTLTIRAVREPEDAKFAFGRVEHPERFVHLSVSDSGTGMTAETRRHIFEPLFTTKKSGTGLGLPLAHQIVARHGGDIYVESAIGHGTTFHLFLPACDPAPRPVATPAPPPPAAPRTRFRRVLLVEDDAAVAAGIVSVLEMEGLEVDIVDNGTDAIETIRANPPDVVVLDVGLPDMEGTAVYDAIAVTHAGLPVIFSTGHADASRLEEYLARPRVSYLLKPYDAEALLAAIEEVS